LHQFWSARKGESCFDGHCEQHGITYILEGIGKPTTQDRKMVLNYDQEHAGFRLNRKFIQYRNYERPHMALNYSTPAEVYIGDMPDVMG
jgi:transposase InsO family protein